MPERKLASTWDQTHDHQVTSLTHSPPSNLGRALRDTESQDCVLESLAFTSQQSYSQTCRKYCKKEEQVSAMLGCRCWIVNNSKSKRGITLTKVYSLSPLMVAASLDSEHMLQVSSKYLQ